jgi:hypothetical protein
MDKPSYLDFDKSKYHLRPDVDYRDHPEEYRVGKAEQGVMVCEPDKGERLGGRGRGLVQATTTPGARLRITDSITSRTSAHPV